MSAKLEDAREALAAKCAELLWVFQQEAGGEICENMALFPVLMLALLKSDVFRPSVSADERANVHNLINTMPASLFARYIYPRMEGPNGTVNLSSEWLERGQKFVLDDTQNLIVWNGSESGVGAKGVWKRVLSVREDGDAAMRLRFLRRLVEDRSGDVWSYPQFLAYLRQRVKTASF